MFYKLVDRKPVRVDSSHESFQAIQDRRVAEDRVDTLTVSTVFLAIDHNYSGVGPPILFETMVFTNKSRGAAIDKYTRRYETWEQAECGHRQVIEELKSMEKYDERA